MLLPCHRPVNSAETLSQAFSNFHAAKIIKFTLAEGSRTLQWLSVCFKRKGLGSILKALYQNDFEHGCPCALEKVL